MANLISQQDEYSCYMVHKKSCKKNPTQSSSISLLPRRQKDIQLSTTTTQLNKKYSFVCYPHTGVYYLSSHTPRCARYPWSVTFVTLTDQDRLPVMRRAHLLLFYTEGTGSASITTFLSTSQATRR